ncbi:thioredoxin domain-containing protein [Campylobacter sp. Cr9]|uniref:thioredoxin domain-containing protein n=1 Tax=unclassified Campylobacter TaxID=2593542 RepID=UPI001EFC1B4B|nr:thioredoxin domain-containing protein [Campylobacter sp. RM5004]MBZ7986263.1 thioredoxin domain-containing protein [Campylobacter sp. Cr9]ULO02289.1 protein disulfide isomerase, DsbG family [Campylobacter sp. RM5004]
MKKIILAMSVASALSASAISDKVAQFIKSITKADVEIVKIDKVPNTNFEMIEFNIVKDGNVLGSDIFFSDGVYGTPTMLNIKESIDLKEEFVIKKEKEKYEKLSKLSGDFVKANPDMLVSLGDKKSDVATVVFSDPDCPYCRKHLDAIEEDLKEANVKFVLSPLPMHPKALVKSMLILEEAKKAKTDSEKIAILKKYYQDSVELKDIPEEKQAEYLKKVNEKIFKMGINSTPSVFTNVKVK